MQPAANQLEKAIYNQKKIARIQSENEEIKKKLMQEQQELFQKLEKEKIELEKKIALDLQKKIERNRKN